ncbi:MAG: hypothetical protein WC753_03350 [Candidatus Gracilibacteria bacterium]|jgi:hypothetical protein
MTILSSLDILAIVSTLVIACVGVYLVIILHRVAHMTRVADRFAQTVEKFQDVFAIVDDIPTNMIRKITDSFPKSKK